MSNTNELVPIEAAMVWFIFAPLESLSAHVIKTAYLAPDGNALLKVSVPKVVAVKEPVPLVTVILPAKSVPSIALLAPEPQPLPIVKDGVPLA